jgi:Mn-dependent DtxR family transcriptional regulator
MITNDVWKKFQENPITHSGAHHLLAIHNLVKEQGYARVTDIAKRLGITTGSVSTNLKVLKQRALIETDENRMLKPSKEGGLLAEAIIARRDIFRKFLNTVLNVEEKQAEIDACKVEHLLSHETSIKLLSFMKSHLDDKKLTLTINNDSEHECSKDSDCSICGNDCLSTRC